MQGSGKSVLLKPEGLTLIELVDVNIATLVLVCER